MKWIKINNEHFDIRDISAQFNIQEQAIPWKGSVSYAKGRTSCDITVVFNFNDANRVFKIFDNRSKFDITSSELIANGCYIKTLDTDAINNTLIADITSDYVKVKDIADIRDEKIDQILNETSDKNKI